MAENTTTTKCLDCLKPGAGNDKHMLIGFEDGCAVRYQDGGVNEYRTWKVGTDPNIIKEDIINTLVEELSGYIFLETKGSVDHYEFNVFGMEIVGTSESDIKDKIISKLKSMNLAELIHYMDNDEGYYVIIFVPAGDMNKLMAITDLINK